MRLFLAPVLILAGGIAICFTAEMVVDENAAR